MPTLLADASGAHPPRCTPQLFSAELVLGGSAAVMGAVILLALALAFAVIVFVLRPAHDRPAAVGRAVLPLGG